MTKLPAQYLQFRDEFPEVASAYDALGSATHEAGPLDAKTRQLAKLAIAIGAQLEGATKAHTRRCLEIGVTPAEIKHTLLLAMTTIGFPSTVKAYTWVNDELNPKDKL